MGETREKYCFLVPLVPLVPIAIFMIFFLQLVLLYRDVAQLGSALRSGRRGRWFESSHPDFWFINYDYGALLRLPPN